MKLRNLFLSLAAVFATGAMAQDDCSFFFLNQEGQQMTRNCYNANGQLTNVLNYLVDKVYQYEPGEEVIANYKFTDANGKLLNSGQMVARCSNGDFSMSMGHVASFPDAMSMLNSDMFMMGDLMNYPDAMSDPDNIADEGDYDDGTIRLYQKNDKNNRAEINVTNREFVKNEIVETPAGPFNCTKVKYNVNLWSPKTKMEGYGYEWYAPNLGIVRTELYNKDGQLQSYTLLDKVMK